MTIKPTPSNVGAAGARRAAALLGIAVCSETSHTTMDEDGAKVDLKLGMRHAFHPGTLLTVHCQVKSGKSFRGDSQSKKAIPINVTAETLDALRLGTQPALVVWVPPPPSPRIYWQLVCVRGRLKGRIYIPVGNTVSPSLRYDLSRAAAQMTALRPFSRTDLKDMDSDALTRRAKIAYRQLQGRRHNHPLVGSLAVTRLAWRHITRRSKPTKQRIESLRVVPYLRYFVECNPSRYLVVNKATKSVGSWTLERREVLMWYVDAFRHKGNGYSLLLRIREEVYFPAAWMSRPLSLDDVRHTATLLSWWCKPIGVRSSPISRTDTPPR